MADYDPSSMSWLGRLISGTSLAPTPASGVPLSIDDPMGFAAETTTPIPPPPAAPVQAPSLGQSLDNWMTAGPSQAAPTPPPAAPPPPPQAAPPVQMAANQQSGMASDATTIPGTQAGAPPVLTPPPQQAGAPPALPAQLPGIGAQGADVAGPGYAEAPPPATPDQQAAQSAQMAAKLQALKQQQAADGPPPPPPPATSDQLGTDPTAPRGIRNNNPLNLTYVSGQPGVVGTDGRFGQYASMTDGIASSVNQLQTYQDRDGLTTPRQMINKWAPGSEKGNDPQAYVAQVAKVSGLDPDAPIDMHDPVQAAKLVAGMSSVENGKPLDPAVALAGAQAAATPRPPGAASGGAPGGSAPPPGSPPPAPSPPAAAPDLPQSIPGIGMNQAYQPATDSEKMMALAAGLMSGPTASIGAAKGLDAMNQLTVQDRENVFKGQQQQAQTAGLLARIPLTQAQTAAIPYKLGQTDNKNIMTGQIAADKLDVARQAAAATLAQHQAANAFRQQQVDNQTNRTNQYVQSQTSALDGTKAIANSLGSATAKDSVDALQKMNNDYQTAGESMQQIANMQALIGTEGITGSSFQEQFKRFAANNLGIDIGVSPSGFSLLDKTLSNFNSNQALANGKGFGGRITQSEFGALQKGVMSLGTDPNAAQDILATYAQAAQRRMQIAEQYHAIVQSDPKAAQSILGDTASGGLGGWYQQQVGGQFAARGITSDPSAPATPSQYAPPTAGSDGWTHVAPAAPGGAPIRYRINPT